MKFLLIFTTFFLLAAKTTAQITSIKVIGDTCNSLTLALQAAGTSSSPYFFWNFNDPSSGSNDTITITGLSASPFPTHTFTGIGVYNVCVTLQEPGQPATTICRPFSLGLCCNGLISSADSCLQKKIPFSITTNATVNSITWDFGDPSTGAANTSGLLNPSHIFSAAGTYTVTATVTADCGQFTNTYVQKVVNCRPVLTCEGSFIAADTCFKKSTSFAVNYIYPINNVVWSFDDPLSGAANTAVSASPAHIFTSAKTFNVRAIINSTCGLDTIFRDVTIINCDTIIPGNCTLYMPTSFTPNGDGKNDYLQPLTPCSFASYEFLIFNRWGQMVYKTKNPSDKWNGTYKGFRCPGGNYVYLVNYQFINQPKKIAKGNLVLIR